MCLEFGTSAMLISLLLHRAFLRFTEYYTPTNALIIYYIIVYIYFTLKPLKCAGGYVDLQYTYPPALKTTHKHKHDMLPHH